MSWMGKYCYHCDSTSLYLLRVYEAFQNPNQKEKLTNSRKEISYLRLSELYSGFPTSSRHETHEREILSSLSTRISWTSKKLVWYLILWILFIIKLISFPPLPELLKSLEADLLPILNKYTCVNLIPSLKILFPLFLSTFIKN